MELSVEQKRRLTRMLTGASEASQFEAAQGSLVEIGMEVGDLKPGIRFNLLLHQFKKSLASAAGSPDDAGTGTLAREFVEGVKRLPGGLAFGADAAPTLTAIEKLIAGTADAVPPVDPTGLGPGAPGAGGRFRGQADAARLTFTSAAGGVALEFIRIDPPASANSGAPSFFIGTTEVSIAMFLSMATEPGTAGGGAGASLGSLLPAPDPLTDTRVGPRTWQWDDRRVTIRPANQWLTSTGATWADQYAPPGKPPSRPTVDHPLTYISPEGAAAAAARVGCRLPSKAEWEAARTGLASAVDAASLNLRDQTWERHRVFVDKQLGAGKNIQSAAAGSFAVAEGAISPTDDRTLWYAPVGFGGGDPLHHIWGNVAEWLLDAGGEVAPTNLGSAAGREFFARHAGDFAVAGGSALSDAAPDAGSPRPVSLMPSSEGFSDVGFRLAFSVGGVVAVKLPLATQLDRVLTPTPFIRVR